MKLLITLFVLLASYLPVTVSAHHSTSEYDRTAMVEFEGVVTEKFWKNPHVIYRVATTRNGVEEEWALEGASVSSQSRRGISQDLINVGDKVLVAGYPSTRRKNDMVLQNILLPSGQELMLQGNGTPRWPDAALVKFSGGIDSAKAATANADGLFRVWTWGAMERGWWFFGPPENFPVTDAALGKFAGWNEFEDNPQLKCIAPGMPNTMGNPYPIEFKQVGNTIVMRAEEFDVSRTIHLDAEPDPSVPHSHMGYSVGHWENDDTLVVSTSNINYPYFNRVGISQSEDVHVEERFNVDDAAGELHYELTVTDPWALTEPYQWKALWVWKPGEVVGTYGCTVAE